MNTMTLLQLRTATRQRADMVNSQFVTDAELNSYINQSYFELYDLLVTAYGEDYYVAPFYTFATDGVNQLYNLPSDFYKMLNVSVQVTASLTNPNNAWWTLKPFMMAEINKYAVPNTQLYFGLSNLRYRIQGNQLFMNPLPQAAQTVRLIYIPMMTQLASDSDTVAGVSGWTEYIIIDAAIKCMQKEESDVSVLVMQKEAMKKRIDAVAANRDPGMPHTVADAENSNSFYPYGSSWGTF